MDLRTARFFQLATLERGLLLGFGSITLGLCLLAGVAVQWWQVAFGPLDYASAMRWAIPGATLTALGLQTVLTSSFMSILGMGRR